MAKYRTFERTWWKDAACTIPGPGRKRYDGRVFETETDAWRACSSDNSARPGYYRHSPSEAAQVLA